MFIVKWEIKCSRCGRHDDRHPGDTSFSETRERAEWFKKVFLEGAGNDAFLESKGEQLEINLLKCFEKPLGTELLEDARRRAAIFICDSELEGARELLEAGESVHNKECNMVLQFTIEEVPIQGVLSPGSATVC